MKVVNTFYSTKLNKLLRKGKKGKSDLRGFYSSRQGFYCSLTFQGVAHLHPK